MKTRYEPVKAKPAKRFKESKRVKAHEVKVTASWAKANKPKGPTPSIKKAKSR